MKKPNKKVKISRYKFSSNTIVLHKYLYMFYMEIAMTRVKMTILYRDDIFIALLNELLHLYVVNTMITEYKSSVIIVLIVVRSYKICRA